MCKRHSTMIAILFLAFFVVANGAVAGSLETLMADLAKVKERYARFVEERTLGILDETLITEGTLAYQAPDQLIRQDLLPDSAVYAINGDQLRIMIDDNEQIVSLDQEPMLAALVLPFRAMFAGDIAALKAMFDPAYTEDGDDWIVTLKPKPSSPTRPFLNRIEIVGRDLNVLRMDVHEQGGDLSSMVLEPVTP